MRSIATPLAGLALIMALSAPSAFAAGGAAGGNSGGGTAPAGNSGGGGATGGNSKNTGALCIKISSSATAAFSYYNSLTLDDNIQNCSNQPQVIETVYSPGPGATPGCVALLADGATYQMTLLAGARVKQARTFFDFNLAHVCAVGDPIIASVVAPDGTVLASTSATWQTGVTP